MAYPVREGTKSLDVLSSTMVESEGDILECLQGVYCGTFLDELINSEDISPERKIMITSELLRIIGRKQCTVAEVLEAVSNLLRIEDY